MTEAKTPIPRMWMVRNPDDETLRHFLTERCAEIYWPGVQKAVEQIQDRENDEDRRPEDFELIKSAYREADPTVTPRQAGARCSQILRFVSEIRKDDWVITKDRARNAYRLGRVTGGRRDILAAEAEISRAVEWEKILACGLVPVQNRGNLGDRRTVFEISEDTARALLALFQSAAAAPAPADSRSPEAGASETHGAEDIAFSERPVAPGEWGAFTRAFPGNRLDAPETAAQKACRQAAHSIHGSNGGNPESPIWLCALEWGGGMKDTEEASELVKWFEDEAAWDREAMSGCPGDPDAWKVNWERLAWKKAVEAYKEAPRFYWPQFALMSLLMGERRMPAPEVFRRWHCLERQGLGYSFNVSFVARSGRNVSEALWRSQTVRDEGRELSWADWTGFATYADFFQYCAQARQPVFRALRKRFCPAVIYCGGKIERENFRRAWAEEDTKFTAVDKYGLTYAWLQNSEGKPDTLLVIGPFFNGPYSLWWTDYREGIAAVIREIAKRRLGSDEALAAWLRREETLGRIARHCAEGS